MTDSLRLARPVRRHRRVDEARVDAVDAHAVRARVPGERLRQRSDARLRRSVGCTGLEPPDLAGERGDHDDRARSTRDHPLEGCLTDEERSAQVDGLHSIPFVSGNVGRGRDLEDAVTCDDDIRLARLLDDPARLVVVADIPDHDPSAHCLSGSVGRLAEHVGADDVGTFPCERLRAGAPDPAARTGDERGLAFESAFHRYSRDPQGRAS